MIDSAPRRWRSAAMNWCPSWSMCWGLPKSRPHYPKVRDLSRLLLGPARARHPQPAAPAAGQGQGPESGRDEGCGGVLRLRRHVLRQISGNLQRHGAQESGQCGGKRRRGAARRRSRLPDEHGRQAVARRFAISRCATWPKCWRARPTRRRSARRERPDGGAQQRVQGECGAGARRRRAAAGARERAARFIRQAPPWRATACPNSRRCASRRATIKDHALAHLDLYLERYEAKVKASGGQVHWAADGAEARAHHPRDLPAARARRPSPRASR